MKLMTDKRDDIDLDEEVVHLRGERITEARAQQMADEAQQWAHNLVPGRKSLSGGSKHSPVVQFRVSETTRDRLEQLAASRGISVSKLSRQALEEFVAREA